jgi:hypothetical protein
MLTTTLLTLGLLLAPLGTLAYVVIAMTEPDVESLRISKTAALIGRWTATAGAAAYLIDAMRAGATISPAMTVVLMAAAGVIVASQLTRLQPPRPPRPV